jgi:hypothetical protein
MKSILALLLVGSLAAGATAQNSHAGRHPNKPVVSNAIQALSVLQVDLQSAIQSMSGALPIYDGNRVRAIQAAHRALLIVDKASNPRATVRPAPRVKDSLRSGQAHHRYSTAQISQSQTSMQRGLTSLQEATTALQIAIGNTPNPQGLKVAQEIQTAIEEAQNAIQMHAGTP